METIGCSDFMLPTLLQTLMAGTDLVASSPLADHSELNASQQLLTGGSQVLQGGEGLHCQAEAQTDALVSPGPCCRHSARVQYRSC